MTRKGGTVAKVKLDTKQQVLVAIYTEYQKDLPDMEQVTPTVLGIEEEHFIVALLKLQNEGLIANVIFAESLSGIDDAFLYRTMMTRLGIEYVESTLAIVPTLSAADKLKGMAAKLAEWGLDQLKDFAARTLAEVVKSQFPGD